MSRVYSSPMCNSSQGLSFFRTQPVSYSWFPLWGRAANEGLDGFLTKPFDNVELRKRIQETIIRKRLRQFVPHQVYKEIKNNPAIMKPKRKRVSVLFCDIRGFTTMSRKIEPEKIAELLNDYYFTPLGEIAYRYNGTVDKHMGDCMMVGGGPNLLDSLSGRISSEPPALESRPQAAFLKG